MLFTTGLIMILFITILNLWHDCSIIPIVYESGSDACSLFITIFFVLPFSEHSNFYLKTSIMYGGKGWGQRKHST